MGDSFALNERVASDEWRTPLFSLPDNSGRLSIADMIVSETQFKPADNGFCLGRDANTIWFRFDVDSALVRHHKWWLVLSQPLLLESHLYAATSDGTFQERTPFALGDSSTQQRVHRKPSFQLDDERQGTTRYFLQVRATYPICARLEFLHSGQLQALITTESLYYALFWGAFGIILTAQIFFWTVTRQPSGMWCWLFTGHLLLTHLFLSGHFQIPDSPTLVRPERMPMMIFGCTAVLSGLLLVRHWKLASMAPRLARLYFIDALFLGALAVLNMVWAGYSTLMHLVTAIGGALLGLLLAVVAYRCYRDDRQLYGILAVLGIFYGIGDGIRALSLDHYVANTFQYEHGMEILALAMAVALSVDLILQAKKKVSRQHRHMKLAIRDSRVALAARTELLRTKIQQEHLLKQGLRELLLQVNKSLEVERTARREQKEFVGMVSHEFRNPLAVIDTIIQRILDEIADVPEKQRARYRHIQNAVHRMTSLINIYLTAERLDSTSVLLHTSCSIEDLLFKAIEEWSEEQVHLTTKNLPSQFLCDAQLLQIAVHNLVENAVRHAFPGTTVVVAAMWDGRKLDITVSNRGVPIPEDEMPMLFNKYFRGRATRTLPGAGLGLFLVAQIAHLHGGTIFAKCHDGVTTFALTIQIQMEVATEIGHDPLKACTGDISERK